MKRDHRQLPGRWWQAYQKVKSNKGSFGVDEMN